ncbi:MAG: lysophospholipid acyltransferase family protein [Ideonella sp.]|nr:lysophospholipid acyltransferase family protein [Ideonella sp.]
MRTILAWLSRRPLWFLHAIGAALGWLTWALSPSYRRRFGAHAALAGVAPAAARRAVAEAGRMVLELPYLWLRPAGAPLAPPVAMPGAEHIDAALAAGRGIVFLTPHLGCFEVTAQAYAERYGAAHGPITVLYRPARKRVLREVVDSARARPHLAAAPATLAGVRQMIRALRRGEAVGLLPDQVPPEGMGVWVPFFGQPAYTMTLAARLVQQTGATPLLAWGERLAHGRGYVVHISALAEPLPLTDPAAPEACAAAINRAMEGLIRQCPQQYLWGYNRYKTPRADADPRA